MNSDCLLCLCRVFGQLTATENSILLYLCGGYGTKRKKVLIELFQKFAVSKGGALVARRNGRNSPHGVSLLLSFSLCAFCAKEKSGKHVLCRYASIIFLSVWEGLAPPDAATP